MVDRRLRVIGWSLIVGGLVGLTVLAAAFYAMEYLPDRDAEGRPLPSASPATATATATATEPASPSESAPASSFDDSGLEALEDLTVLGGTDVPAGLYRVIEPVEGDSGVNGGILFDRSCKWGLYEGAERGIDQIAMANVTDGGHPVMRIADGQRAYSQNCGAWALVDEPLPASADLATSIDDGYWAVGIDVAEGTYERLGVVDGDDPDTWCVWTVLESFEPGAATVAQEFDFTGDGPRTVDLADGQVLDSSVCGGWQRVG
ncbi:hypothetical protein [Demequina sp.]|uniref:hypothetical protein n=1 Tax=Demequina sp. TaxID=2050685 RepID=UPI0025C05FCF|nr:hypothetical protein [Demequina sp.]